MCKIFDKSKSEVIKEQKRTVKKIFDLRGKFAIIGLTGRTGSGCSTAAEIISQKTFKNLKLPQPKRNGVDLTHDDRKYQICYDYLSANWAHVHKVKIKVTYIILWIFMSLDQDRFNKLFSEWFKQTYLIDTSQTNDQNTKDQDTQKKIEEKNAEELNRLEKLLTIFDSAYTCKIEKSNYKQSNCRDKLKELQKKEYRSNKNNDNGECCRTLIDFFEKFFEELYQQLKKKISEVDPSYNIDAFQLLGNFIREKLESETIVDTDIIEQDNPENYHLSIIVVINLLIKLYRYKSVNIDKEDKIIIIIDALRNPYEIMFLRERYSAFYAMSVNTSEDERQRRLYMKSYSRDQIRACDDTEYPKKPKLRDIYMKQNIERCNEISDIHLVNEEKDNKQPLAEQIALYLSLILHPGLVTPTNKERTMQIAYTAKYNSGCISRQVGAVITDEHFTIKAIGWNDVPEGQTPCLLRNIYNVYNQQADKIAYSNYEWNNKKFQEKLALKIPKEYDEIKNILKGRNVPYCFKDIYNEKDKGQNNQVHTRSLHAEENAFLQIAKYGGQGIKGGKLFTTASPCELCAKKAYQLGIKEIYYIDLYPGISKKHILENGSNCPDMKLFNGAIGRAYIHLYQPLLSYKDELRDLLEPEKH